MLVGEIMTRDVVTVAPDTTVAEVAQLFSDKGISGAPVVNKSGDVVGVVSEADLLHRAEIHTEKQHSWWARLFQSDFSLAQDFIRQGAKKVADVMSTDLMTVSEDAKLAIAADLLDRHHIKRLVVLRGQKLAGIITRADIVRALAKHKSILAQAPRDSSDDALLKLLEQRMSQEPWANAPYVNTHVQNGVIELSGFVSSATQKQALRVLAETLPGAKAVEDRVQIFVPPVAMAT